MNSSEFLCVLFLCCRALLNVITVVEIMHSWRLVGCAGANTQRSLAVSVQISAARLRAPVMTCVWLFASILCIQHVYAQGQAFVEVRRSWCAEIWSPKTQRPNVALFSRHKTQETFSGFGRPLEASTLGPHLQSHSFHLQGDPSQTREFLRPFSPSCCCCALQLTSRTPFQRGKCSPTQLSAATSTSGECPIAALRHGLTVSVSLQLRCHVCERSD